MKVINDLIYEKEYIENKIHILGVLFLEGHIYDIEYRSLLLKFGKEIEHKKIGYFSIHIQVDGTQWMIFEHSMGKITVVFDKITTNASDEMA